MIISKKKKIQPESSKSLLPSKSTSASSLFNFNFNCTKERMIRNSGISGFRWFCLCRCLYVAQLTYVPYLFRILTCFLGGGLNIANIHSQDYRFSRNGKRILFLLTSIFFPRSCSWQLPKTENEVKLKIFCHFCHFCHHCHRNHHLLYQQHHHQ